MTNKALMNLQRDLGHGSQTDMTAECIRINAMTKKVGLRISATIQEYENCTNRGRNFKLRYRPVENFRKFDHMVSMTDLYTGLTTSKLAKFVDSDRTSLNKIVEKRYG